MLGGAQKLRIGLLMNPCAGIGGPAGLKGSDGIEVQTLARAQGIESQVCRRVVMALASLAHQLGDLHWVTCSGAMGEQALLELGIDDSEIVYITPAETEGQDTKRATRALQDAKVDVLLFAGGDGTARDLLDAATAGQSILGIPCGVKMHSGVFANHPLAVAEILRDLLAGRLLSAAVGEVRDIDEVAFRQGRVIAKFYGELQIPAALSYIQSTKVGGRESEGLAQQEIAADFVDSMLPDIIYFMGSGQTVAGIMAALGLPNTLLGVDVICNQGVLQNDVTSLDLLRWTTQGQCRIVVTVIGGQGHVFGRGNQQFSPEVIRVVGLPAIEVVATKTKLEGLTRGFVIVDTGDQDLDAALSGVHRIRTGYQDAVLMRWGTQD